MLCIDEVLRKNL